MRGAEDGPAPALVPSEPSVRIAGRAGLRWGVEEDDPADWAWAERGVSTAAAPDARTTRAAIAATRSGTRTRPCTHGEHLGVPGRQTFGWREWRGAQPSAERGGTRAGDGATGAHETAVAAQDFDRALHGGCSLAGFVGIHYVNG